jgi:protein-disulfide isomerase
MAAMRPSVQGGRSRRNVLITFALAIVVAAALVVFALVLRDRSQAPEVVPNPVVNLTGIAENDTVLGELSAKVTLIEYADQQCPACRYYTLAIFPTLVNEYVRPGKVKMRYQGYPFIGSDSKKALRFLLAAGLQDRLWQLQEALYRYQGRENGGWVTDDLIRTLAAKIPGLDVDKLFADAESKAIEQKADAQNASANAAGIPETPTFFLQVGKGKPYYVRISGLTDFRAALNDALKG